MALDIEFVRAQFPAFAEDVLAGQAFFENAGGSYTCSAVIDRLTRFYTQRKVQPYSAYDASALGGAEMDEARSRLAQIMGVDTDEVSFGPSTTQNTYVLAQAFAEFMQPGEAIVVTNQDHEANSGPWRRLEARGIEVREWQIDPQTGHLDPERLSDLLDEKVRLVCFSHCSNVVGEINDYVSSKNSVRLIGTNDAANRAPTVALATQSNAEELAAALAPHGVMAGGGDFYAQRPLEAMGVDMDKGVLRLSFVHYTSEAEIDQLMKGLDHIL